MYKLLTENCRNWFSCLWFLLIGIVLGCLLSSCVWYFDRVFCRFTLANAIEYRVQPGKWHSQRVSTSAATSRDKMNRHTSHGNSPYRLRKKFGSTRTMFTPHTHQFEMCYLCECVRTLYSMTIGQWSVKIMVLSCKESQFIEGLFWNQFGYFSYLPLVHY